MKAIRYLALLLVLVGAALSGRALYLRAKAELAAVLIRRAWEQTLQSGAPHRPWPWADTHPVARMKIPRLGYDEIVLEGATPRTLAFGPAHMLSGSNFGEAGNLLLAGHRTSWLRPLESVLPGDNIEVQWLDRRGRLHDRTYTVDLTRVIKPDDAEWLAPTPQDALTLITCYPFGHSPYSPQRFVVRASPTGETAVAISTPPISAVSHTAP